MDLRLRRLSLILALPLAACGGQDVDGQASDEVVGGTLQNLTNPEIGRFLTPFSGACTATLIAPDIAISAAHCVRYESSGTGGGNVTFRASSGSETASVRAYRSFSTQPGQADVALLKLDRAVRAGSPRPLTARAPRTGETVELWGYGCTERGVRNSQGKTTLTSRFGSSHNLCPGDSGGPLLDASGGIVAINSAYNTVTGADIFAVPWSLRASIQAQVEAWGHTGSVFGGASGNTSGGEAGALSSSARVWRQTGGLSACGSWSKTENFASGSYNAHRWRVTLSPGGTVDVALQRLGGTYSPALVVAVAGGAALGDGRNASSGVTMQTRSDGRSGGTARVTLSAERTVSLDVFVTGWRAVDNAYRTSLSRDARYQLTMAQSCGSTPTPPPSTAIRSLPFRTRGDTRQGTNTYSRYSCAPNTNESGPELVYTIEATVPGVIAAQLSNLPAGVDVDVHIVVGDTCVSRGNWSASAYVPAGRHRIIVDSWVDSAGRVRSGAFDLLVGYTQPTDLAEAGLTTVAADRALVAFAQAYEQGATDRFVYTIVDLDQPSNQPRLVAWDLLNQAVVTRAYVGHGVGSTMEDDPARVVSVGDDLARSPVGLLLTGERTQGPDGLGIQLDGIEPGFNDNARARSLQLISDYTATADYVNAHGAPALTQGDLTVAPDVLARLSDAVGDGALVILHFSDPAWLDTSDYLEP